MTLILLNLGLKTMNHSVSSKRSRKKYREMTRKIANRGLGFEPLEARVVLNSDLVISEVVASNIDGHLNAFSNDSDWFEIQI